MPIRRENGEDYANSWGHCTRCGAQGDVHDDLRATEAVCRRCGGDGEGNPMMRTVRCY